MLLPYIFLFFAYFFQNVFIFRALKTKNYKTSHKKVRRGHKHKIKNKNEIDKISSETHPINFSNCNQ